MEHQWNSKEQLLELLISLVERASITGSQEEVALSEYIYYLLKGKKYFQQNREYLGLHPVHDGRSFVTALVRQGDHKETIVLLSHFDVVDVKDYGDLKNLAFQPIQLTNELKNRKSQLSKEVLKDLESDEWLFGRGTMDMKAGLSVQLSMLEKAISGEFQGNILLVTVPDEEVNSAGMLSAVAILEDIRKKYDLTYKACINSEPMFAKYPYDENQYIYSGSIGKMLASFYCSGIETHVGEPFSGLNATTLISEINRNMELNDSFCEQIGNEVTPPPTGLMMRDLKQEYSVQIPHTSVSMYNILMFNQAINDIHEKLLSVAKIAAINVEEFYKERATNYQQFVAFTPLDLNVNVFTYEELLEKAVAKSGESEVRRRLNYLAANRGAQGDRDFSTRMVSELAGLCKEYSPMIVLFYSPPFYPAVSSSNDRLIQKTIQKVISYTQDQYGITLNHQHYFPGLSDLSFVQLNESKESIAKLTTSMPLYGKHFHLPFQEMKSLNIPALNIGPVGRDPHKWTERLHIPYAFDTLPSILEYAIKSLLR
ncbi:arginine utilization protein RocB [Metabacillus crassostreae]|uniref:M20/M25/M40 family metallo-hydrolase n=1 Tax=Metabacillus crassostreae TaxID=929098 RepID=UPI0019563285|nr:M20/M25/M40 family metallo-hydrolase [Metabacillus crassostreae]MBM7604531.1 arginine utilization protein RocB [Metabacillus crassostreae]